MPPGVTGRALLFSPALIRAALNGATCHPRAPLFPARFKIPPVPRERSGTWRHRGASLNAFVVNVVVVAFISFLFLVVDPDAYIINRLLRGLANGSNGV